MASQKQSHVPVVIHSFRSPASVWASEGIWDGMSLERRQLMELEMKIACEVSRKKDSSLRELDQLVAVQCPEDQRKWVRGRILDVLQLIHGPKYEVALIDRGNKVRVKPDRLRNLPYKCDELPPQAMNIVLEGVVPVKLGISSTIDAMNPEVSLDWTNRADAFVNKILSEYTAAWFVVDESHPAINQTHFGDLLIEIDKKRESLTNLLIENGHAKCSSREFEKRIKQEKAAIKDGGEINHSPCILSWDESSSSCAPSPVTVLTMPESSVPNQPRKTINEILESKRKSQKPVTPQDVPEKSHAKGDVEPSQRVSQVTPQDVPEISQGKGDMEQPQHISQSENSLKPLSKPTRLSLLVSKFKSLETTSRTAENASNKNTQESSAVLNKQPTQDSGYTEVPPPDGAILNKQPTQDPGHIEIPLPAVSRRLDERFIPAGKLIVKEKKSIAQDVERRKKGLKESFNHKSGDCSSDSSFSDYKTETSVKTETSFKTETSLPPKAKDSLNSAGDSCDSSSDSPPSITGSQKLSSLLMKLKKSPTKKSSEVKLSDSENMKTENIQFTSSSARNRILSIAKVDDSTENEDYLARSVLLHGGFPPSPWVTYEQLKSKFSAHVEQLLIDRRWCYSILTLEKFMWPAILQRQNVIMISPPKTGKTFSYIIPLMDFMIDAEHVPKGNGPIVLILCPGSKSAVEVYESCVKVVNGAKKAPRVHVVYGEEISPSTIYKLVNGCEVLITTPRCFLRIISNVKYVKGYAINLRRMCHYVLEMADVLMIKFLNEMKEIQAMVVAEQESRTLKHDETDPIQIIVSSEQWEPHLPSYTKHMLGNPLLCINNCFEACVYGKPEVSFHLTRSKPTKLLEILKSTAGLNKVVVFCKEEEITALEEFLQNACIDILVTRPSNSLQQLNATLLRWRSSKAGQHYTLLCTDCEFNDLKVQDAMCVVHYSFPTEDKSIFVKRLSAILLNLPNIFEKRVHGKSPSIQLILDESNTEQLPVIVQLMHRISKDIPQNLLEKAEFVRKEKEKKQKINRIFCLNLKMFGECTRSDCPSRHVFIPELDVTEDLPGDGLVKVLVSEVRNAGHFSARVKEHTRLDGSTVKWPSQYTQISCMMFDYFSKQQNRKLIDSDKIAIKDIYAMETIQDLFHRVEILEVVEKDKHGNPSVVKIKFLEEGGQKNVKVFCLYSLPEELKVIPAQSVDVFLCGLLPGDLDDSYDIHATACVKQLIKFVEDSSEDIFIQGKVVFSMSGSLWLDPVGVCEWLPNTGTKVIHNNIKQTLLEKGHAVTNSNHLPKLFALCGKQLPELKVQEVSNVCKPLPRADWAFLESENPEEIEFICAETVENVTLFYVQRIKFKPLLINLIDEINKDSSQRKEEEVLSLCIGDICLARYEEKWQRAKILARNVNSATVFYVDYGDGGTVSLEEIKSIPSWAVTKLPFQAIECSLAGISAISCDLLYEITDDGGRDLYAQVCDCKAAKTTGGKHFLVVLIDPVNGSNLNTDLLKLEFVGRCEDEVKYLDIPIDEILYRNNSGAESDLDETNFVNIDNASIVNLDEGDMINPDDLGFKDDELSYLPDEYDEGVEVLDGFEVIGIEEFLKNSNLSKLAENAVSGAHGRGIMDISKSCETPAECLDPHDQTSRKMIENKQIKGENSEEKNNSEDDDLSDWGEGGNFVGRCRLPVLCNARPPRTRWMEDLYYVWIKICITGVKNYFLQWTYDTFQFSTTDGGRHYLIDQKLRGTIIPCSVKSSIKGFTVEVKMKKALSGVDWGMPFASQRKLPWVSRDIESNADVSSDSDCDISIGTINKEMRKLPLKLRRKRVPKHMQECAPKPDIDSSGDSSNCEYEQIDSDEMF